MKIFLKIIFLLFVFLQFRFAVIAQEQIQNFNSQIVINKDGTVDVEERIDYDFDLLERHGIYREIPFTTKNKDGKKFKLEIKNFQVVDETGKAYQFSKTINNEQLTIKIGDPNKTVTGLHAYIIKYKVYGSLTYFSDHDELYWNVTGNEWTIPNAAASSMVILPETIRSDEIKSICYTGPDGSTEQNCQISITNNQVDIKTSQQLNTYEGLTFAVSFPKGHVAVLESKPYLTFSETIWGKITLGIIIFVAILWYVVYPIWIPIKWLIEGRDPSPKFGDGQVRAWFDRPKTATGRVMTPEESGALIDERVDMEDISSLLVSLAQKGFIKIEERKKGDFYFVKRNEYLNSVDLIPLEITFLRELFKSGDEYHLQKNKLYDAVEKAKTEIYERLVSEGFFTANPNNIRNFYTGIGALALTTFNLPLVFSAFLFGRQIPKKTVLGVETANVAKSLKNFLSSQERQLKFQADKQLMFEKLLPYAIAFGVEKVWAKRFANLNLKPPEWYSGYSSSRGFNSVYFTNNLNSSFSSLRSAATPVSSSTGHSSGFSGGSSGGGGGGGGGGSW